MNSIENKNGENTGKRADKKIEDIYRISISKAAEKALIDVLEKVTRDFPAGQINRSQLAGWILLKFADDASADDIRAIRMDHVNELVLLEHYYREAKESGKLQPEVRDFVRNSPEWTMRSGKDRKKRLPKVINDDIIETEDNSS